MAASTSIVGSLALHSLLGTFSRDVDVYIALTEFTRRILMEEGIEGQKILVKPNFLADAGQPGKGDGDFVLFVGRLEPEKGIRTLLDAWRTGVPRTPLKIAGDGSLRSEVLRAAEEIADIEYLGRRTQAEVGELLGEAAMLVFPSEWFEGFPLVLVESMAAGCPILASDVGNFSELIEPGITGERFTAGSAMDLARQAERMLAQPERLRQMRARCRDRFQSCYTAEANYPLIMKAYEQALDQASSTCASC